MRYALHYVSHTQDRLCHSFLDFAAGHLEFLAEHARGCLAAPFSCLTTGPVPTRGCEGTTRVSELGGNIGTSIVIYLCFRSPGCSFLTLSVVFEYPPAPQSLRFCVYFLFATQGSSRRGGKPVKLGHKTAGQRVPAGVLPPLCRAMGLLECEFRRRLQGATGDAIRWFFWNF